MSRQPACLLACLPACLLSSSPFFRLPLLYSPTARAGATTSARKIQPIPSTTTTPRYRRVHVDAIATKEAPHASSGLGFGVGSGAPPRLFRDINIYTSALHTDPRYTYRPEKLLFSADHDVLWSLADRVKAANANTRAEVILWKSRDIGHACHRPTTDPSACLPTCSRGRLSLARAATSIHLRYR